MKKKVISNFQMESKKQSHSRQDLAQITLNDQTLEVQRKRSNTFLVYSQAIKATPKRKGDDTTRVNTSQRSQTYNTKKAKLPPLFSPLHTTEGTTFTEVASYHNPRPIKKPKELPYESEVCLTTSVNDFRRSKVKRSIDEKEVTPKKIINETISSTHKLNKELCFSPHSSLNSRYVNKNKGTTKILIKAKSLPDSDSNGEDENKHKPPLENKSFGLSQAGKNQSGTKPNQDSFLLTEKVLGLSDYHIYGIMDGHGTNGQYVSQFISLQAQRFFSTEENYSLPKDTSITSQVIKERLEHKDYCLIKSFYKKMSQELPNAKFDVHFSGTTCVLVFLIDKTIICANTGDSRAILIRDNNSLLSPKPKSHQNPFCSYEPINLSLDHKPENDKERERIESLGGVVDQYPEEGGIKSGPYRVWVKGELYPGIAISRTLGDEIAESVGVIYNPDVISKALSESDKYFVLASDGVWEFLDNTKVMNIANSFYLQNDPEGACNFIISESTKWWEKEDVVIDDITVIVGFLRNNW